VALLSGSYSIMFDRIVKLVDATLSLNLHNIDNKHLVARMVIIVAPDR
jgi:predicted Co/Zn/Cd cation transporter (cation efflux family)